MSVHLKENDVGGHALAGAATGGDHALASAATGGGAGPFIVPVRDADWGFGLWPWAKGPLWKITREHVFAVEIDGFKRTYVIPAGYEFDKASIPPVFWGPPFNYTPDGLCTIAALEHDFLCDLLRGGSDWLRARLPIAPLWREAPPAELVHWYFEQRLIAEGVRPGKARWMGRAVRWFGPGGKFRRRID